MIVSIRACQVSQGRFALDPDIILEILDVENGLRRVMHMPDNDGTNLDGIAALVVHLKGVAVEIPRSQGHLEATGALRAVERRAIRSGMAFSINRSGQCSELARAIRIKGISPVETS